MLYEPQTLFEHFFIVGDYPINAERGRYVLSLVFLSFLIAIIGAFASLRVIKALFAAKTRKARTQFHILGAICFAATIWSMHFVGMLAYDMDMVHSYDFLLTCLSMLIAASVAFGFIGVIRFCKANTFTYFVSAFLLGVAICAMHYSGMAAMKMDADILYKPDLFLLSLIIAFSASAAAMWLVYRLRKDESFFWHALSSVMIGVAVCGMHYTGMVATVFLPYADCRFDTDQTYHTLAMTVIALNFMVYIASYLLVNVKTYGHGFGDKRSLFHFVPVAIFVCGIAFVVLCVVFTESALKKHKNRKFDNLTYAIEKGIIERYALYEQALYAGLGFYESSDYVGHDEWRSFIDAQGVEDRLPGINGIGFIKYLEASEVDDFNREYSQEIGRTFVNHPATNFENKFVIKYIEPVEKNTEAVGLDIGFEGNRREAAERSIETGAPSLTRIIELVQDNKARPGFLLLLPFFKADESGQKNIYGWVYAPFIGENFLTDLVDLASYEVSFSVYDGLSVDQDSLIYRSEMFEDGFANDQLSKTRVIEVAGRPWSIVFKTTPIFSKIYNSNLPILQIIAGLIITVLLSVMTFLQNTKQQTIQKLVDTKTHELKALSEGLEEKVERRTFALERANKAKDTFLANMSHELRTPLNSIIGLVDILKEEKSLQVEHKNTLQIVNQSSQTLLEIVNDILDISKIEADMIELESIPFDLAHLMQSITGQLKPLSSRAGLVLNSNAGDFREIPVVGDTFRLNRILLNLGSNAIKYTPKGEVSLKFSVEENADDSVVFQCDVIDTGIGIANDKIEHIFEKFTQAEESTARKFGGTGLGLNITKQLTEIMGGDISVVSELDEGSTFSVRFKFPKTTMEAVATEKARAVEEMVEISGLTVDKKKKTSDARILVAEDYEFNQFFIRKLLEVFGFKDVTVVDDGEQVIEQFKAGDYDIILMDCHMPKMTGYDAAKAIRKAESLSEAEAHIPILALTADAMQGTRQKCIAAGMDAYITKPIDSNTLKGYLDAFFIVEDVPVELGGADAEVSDDVVVSDDAPVDLEVLIECAHGDEDGVKELIELFYENSLKDIASLKDNVRPGKNMDWCEAAHKLKGGAAYVGADTLKLLCSEAQDMKNVTKKLRKAQYDQILAEHEKICDYLKEQGFIN